MKVIYFHQHFSTPAGSAGTRSYEFARGLIESGHDVLMVCGSYAGGATELSGAFRNGVRTGAVDGINIVEFELPYSNRDGFVRRVLTFLKYAWRSVRMALHEDYDVIFATSTPLTASIPGIAAALFRRKPFVFEVRDLWPELPREMGVITNPIILWLMSVLEWISYRTATACIGLAPGIVAGIERLGVAPERIHFIPNGCDLDFFSAEASEGGGRPAGVGQDDFVAVFAGTHGIANGLDAVLDVAQELQKRGRSDIKLVLVGDGGLKPKLIERATRAGLANCVFLPGMPKARLARLFADSDAGLMLLANVPAFYFGTSPNKFFDYISAGLPVITNYPGWIAQLLSENACGIAVPPEDPGRFADALETMANDRALRLSMRRNGRALAEREFDRVKLAKEFQGVLIQAARRA